MNKATIFFRMCWRVFYFLNIGLWFIPFYPLFYYFCAYEKRFPTGFKIKKFFARFTLALSGVGYTVTEEEKLDPKQAYVLCPNHSSYIDIIVSFAALPVYFHMMAKAELKKVPLFNVFFIAMDIPVDRGSLKDSHRAFVRCGEDIDKGRSIALFPEATIPDFTPRLGRFKNGPFKLAIEKQVPIVPITYKDNWHILPDGRKAGHGGHPGTGRIIIHKPISTKGMTLDDLVILKNQVFDTIDAELRRG